MPTTTNTLTLPCTYPRSGLCSRPGRAASPVNEGPDIRVAVLRKAGMLRGLRIRDLLVELVIHHVAQQHRYQLRQTSIQSWPKFLLL